MEMIFHSHANKTHFHKKGCALGLILKVRVFGTRKWPIAFLPISLMSPSSLIKLPIIRLPTVICSPANMFFLHFWPLQFYIWLSAATTVSAFGFKSKEFAWFSPRFSLKVLLPEVFLNVFTATEGFQVILPVTEDSQSKSRTIFSLSPNHWLGTQQKLASKVLSKTEKKEMRMTLSLCVVSCGSLFRTLCR